MTPVEANFIHEKGPLKEHRVVIGDGQEYAYVDCSVISEIISERLVIADQPTESSPMGSFSMVMIHGGKFITPSEGASFYTQIHKGVDDYWLDALLRNKDDHVTAIMDGYPDLKIRVTRL